MKKILLSAALVIAMGFGANAQNDNYFNTWDDVSNNTARESDFTPTLPESHNLTDNQSVPVGSGLLVLTALGAGYALTRKREE